MNRWIKNWKGLKQADRYRILVIWAAAVTAAYAFYIYPISHGKFQESENMVNRRLNRISAKTEIKVIGDVQKVDSLRRKKAELEENLDFAQNRLEDNMSGLVPINSPGQLQQLRLDISNLARQSGFRVNKAGASGNFNTVSTKGRSIRKNKPKLGNNPYGRPLFHIQAEASYWDLVTFLEEVQNLRYMVSVVRLQAEVMDKPSNNPAEADIVRPPGQLSIELVLTL
jgi:hypothetical protein